MFFAKLYNLKAIYQSVAVKINCPQLLSNISLIESLYNNWYHKVTTDFTDETIIEAFKESFLFFYLKIFAFFIFLTIMILYMVLLIKI